MPRLQRRQLGWRCRADGQERSRAALTVLHRHGWTARGGNRCGCKRSAQLPRAVQSTGPRSAPEAISPCLHLPTMGKKPTHRAPHMAGPALSGLSPPSLCLHSSSAHTCPACASVTALRPSPSWSLPLSVTALRGRGGAGGAELEALAALLGVSHPV